jgi:hypothetical protein
MINNAWVSLREGTTIEGKALVKNKFDSLIFIHWKMRHFLCHNKGDLTLEIGKP